MSVTCASGDVFSKHNLCAVPEQQLRRSHTSERKVNNNMQGTRTRPGATLQGGCVPCCVPLDVPEPCVRNRECKSYGGWRCPSGGGCAARLRGCRLPGGGCNAGKAGSVSRLGPTALVGCCCTAVCCTLHRCGGGRSHRPPKAATPAPLPPPPPPPPPPPLAQLLPLTPPPCRCSTRRWAVPQTCWCCALPMWS